MAGEKRTTLPRHTRAAGNDGAGAFLCAAFSRPLLLGYHCCDAAAARRAVQQTDRWTAKVNRQPVEVRGLATDRAVRVSAARGKIVGAYHCGAARNLAPPSHVVGGREPGDASLVVVIGEPRKAANFAKGAGVKQQANSFAAGQLASAPLADDPWITRIGRESSVSNLLQRLHVGEHWCPAVLAVAARPRTAAGSPGGSQRRDDLPCCDGGTNLGGADRGQYSSAGRRNGGFHLHRADNHQD